MLVAVTYRNHGTGNEPRSNKAMVPLGTKRKTNRSSGLRASTIQQVKKKRTLAVLGKKSVQGQSFWLPILNETVPMRPIPFYN